MFTSDSVIHRGPTVKLGTLHHNFCMMPGTRIQLKANNKNFRKFSAKTTPLGRYDSVKILGRNSSLILSFLVFNGSNIHGGGESPNYPCMVLFEAVLAKNNYFVCIMWAS